MRRETAYQRDFIKRLRANLPDCFVIKNDPAENQGIPDILILFRNQWAMLECKWEDNSPKQPNQEYYIDKFGEMSFASFINPQTEEQVLRDLQISILGVSW